MNVDNGIQIDLLGTLKRRANLAAVIAGVVFLAIYWIAMALPNQYESYATILVEPQAVSNRLVEAGVAGSDLNSRLNLMTAEILSRARLSRIIDDLELYREESEYMLREEVIALMRSRIQVMPVTPELEAVPSREGAEINTFRISFTGATPRQAANVAQRIGNDFIEEHIDARVQTTQKSLEFIQAEQERLAQAIQLVEQRVAEVKDANPGRLPDDLLANQRLAERTLGDLRSAQRELDNARSDEAFWTNQSLAVAVTVVPRDDASPGRRLQLLELMLAEYRSRGYTDKHPDIQQALLELQELRRAIEFSESDEEGSEAPMNFAQQSAEAERRRAALRVAGTTSEIERLNESLEAIQGRIAATPRVSEQLDSLEREQGELSESLSDFSRRRLEATVQANLERRQLGEQFRIIEAAFPPTEPSSPNRALILVMGLLLALGLGGGVGMLMESMDSSLHDPRQLQAALSLPVLASIPAIVLESDRAARARRLMRNGIAAVVFTVFCLAGGALTYVWVNGAPGFISDAIQGGDDVDASIPRTTARG